MRSETHDARIAEERAAELRTIIERHPDYPHTARAYYFLGANLGTSKQYREAYRAFTKAVELRPALDSSLPVRYRLQVVHREWLRSFAGRTSWGILGVVLAASAVLFFVARPWRSLGLRHAVMLAAVCLAWWLLLNAAAWALDGQVRLEKLSFEKPAFVSGLPGSPGSERLTLLFRYGLLSILGAFVIAVGLSKLRLKWTRAAATGIASLLVCACLMTVFYLRHCDRGGFFEPGRGEILTRLRGGAFFPLADLEPYVLTNPRAYPDMRLSEIDEHVLKAWLERQYSIIAADEKAGTQERDEAGEKAVR
jgi:hypothetical protein